MKNCNICGEVEVPKARRKIGKKHCTGKECVAEWRRREIERNDLALVFVHKQGLQWVRTGDVKKNDMKRAGGL